MARSLSTIYNEIITFKDSQAQLSALAPSADTLTNLLAQLSSRSKVADWRLWAYLVAVAIWVHELLWDAFKAEVEAIAASAKPHNLKWYQAQALLFQLGDALVDVTGVPTYATIDPSKRIVKRASATEDNSGLITIKLAKLSGSTPVPLTATEIVQFQAYLNSIKEAGANTQVVSLNADKLRLFANIFYDPLFDPATVQAAVGEAVDAYLEAIPFNGVVNVTALIDAIQAVQGVTDVVIQAAETQVGAGAWIAINREYQTLAGYIVHDSANHPYSTTLNMIPV